VLLSVYLTALGFSPLEIGILAGVALLGSALITLAIGVLGVRQDHRALLICTAGLMTVTGIALSVSDSYAVLLGVAFIGLGVPQPKGARIPAHRIHPVHAQKAMQSHVMSSDRWGDGVSAEG
jgi:MFS family permease